MEHSPPPAKPSFREALAFWAKLGFISFGGPAGQVAIMHDHVVEKKRWISDSRFLHALNYCMVLPGPEAQQLATYIGWLLHGSLGGLAAGILFVLPSMFILLGLSIAYVSFGQIPWVLALFLGLKPAVIAIVIGALIKIGGRSLKTVFHWIVAALAFVSIWFFHVPFPLIILGAVLLAVAARRISPTLFSAKARVMRIEPAPEASYYLHSGSVIAGGGFKMVRLLRQLLIAFVLWVLPFIVLRAFAADAGFWETLSLFFTKAAFVTFGGAYAVLPYVAQVSVEQLGWLSSGEMIDGLALGETTPGPLIMVLAFVGFMAGHNHFGGSLALGTLGLVTTTWFTFLPCFLFVFAGAPVIESTRGTGWIKEALAVVTAAVVGVMLNLTLYLGNAVLFPNGVELGNLDWWALAWIVISLVALQRFNVNMMLWLGISALFGLTLHLLAS